MLKANCPSERCAVAMETVSASHVGEAWWTEACKKVRNALVFIDGPAAESLHWNGGLGCLADAGAKNVKEFSSFEVFTGCLLEVVLVFFRFTCERKIRKKYR